MTVVLRLLSAIGVRGGIILALLGFGVGGVFWVRHQFAQTDRTIADNLALLEAQRAQIAERDLRLWQADQAFAIAQETWARQAAEQARQEDALRTDLAAAEARARRYQGRIEEIRRAPADQDGPLAPVLRDTLRWVSDDGLRGAAH